MSKVDSTPRALATLGLGALAVLAGLAPALGPALEFGRLHSWIAEPWRLLTAHLVHFGLEHLAWDLGALLLLGLYVEPRRPGTTRLVLLASALAIPLVFMAAEPDLQRYRGLSGLASALFMLALCQLQATSRTRFARVLVGTAGLGFAAKLLVESTSAAPVFVGAESFVPVASAHLTGALIGLAGGLSGLFEKPRTPSSSPTLSLRSGRVAAK